MSKVNTWELDLLCKRDFNQAMKRVNAWFVGGVIDRAPIRFTQHNADYNGTRYRKEWKTLQERWFDIEYLLNDFERHLQEKTYLAETFPVFWPNLGPNWYAACHGATLQWGEVTSWAQPLVEDIETDFKRIQWDTHCELFVQMDKMMQYALDRCEGKYMVGYTDLHPGIDCAAAWRDTQNLLMDFYDAPETVKRLVEKSEEHFFDVYEHYDAMIKAKNQLSVTWMNIPAFETMHIPSADFSAMISTSDFDEYVMPSLVHECGHFSHNVFHVDGKGVARHIDSILSLPNLKAIQWVQGVAEDAPIMQWVPFIKKVLDSGKSIVVDIALDELEAFIAEFKKPDGIYLCLPADDLETQTALIKRVEKW